MADPAGSTRIGFEVPNALGALWQTAPRLAAKLTRLHNYAKAVQTYLRAVDFYCQQHGVSSAGAKRRLRVDTTVTETTIVQRIG